jgi:O-antigen/teichoic acid export membrane protein
VSSSLSQKLVRNTLYNVLGKSWGIFLSLLLVPFLLAYLGLERFGLWALFGVVAGYFSLLDFGFGSSFVKYISEFQTRSDFDRLNQVVRIGLVFYGLLSLVVAALVVPCLPIIPRLFRVDSSLLDEARFVLGAGIAVLFIQNTLSVFTAVIQGLQRMDLSNKTHVAVASFRAVGIVTCIVGDYGLRGLMINQMVVAAGNGVAMMILSYRQLPQLRLRPWRWDRALWRRMFTFGTQVQVSRVAQMIAFQMDRLLVGYFFSVASVAFYDVAIRVSSAMRTLPLLLTSAIVPAASELDTRENRPALCRLHLLGSKYLVFSSLPLAAFVLLHARQMIFVWVGPGFEPASVVLQLLAVGYFLNLVSGTASTIAMGMGRPGLEMRYGVVMAILNLGFSLFWIWAIGLYGAALGSALALGCGSIYFVYLFHRLIEQPLGSFVRLFRAPLAAVILAALLTFLAGGWFSTSGEVSRLYGGMQLVGRLALFAAVYLLSIWRMAYFARDEMTPVLGKIPWLQRSADRWVHGNEQRQI